MAAAPAGTWLGGTWRRGAAEAMKLRSHVWWVGAVAIASLLGLLGQQLAQRWEPMERAQLAMDELQAMERLAGLVHELQRERGLSSGWLGGASLDADLAAQRERTDDARRHAGGNADLTWIDLTRLDEHRLRVRQRALSAQDSNRYYGAVIAQVISRTMRRARAQDDGPLRREQLLHAELQHAKEHLGQLRSVVAEQLADHRRGLGEISRIERHRALFDEYVDRYLQTANDGQALALAQVTRGAAMRRVDELLAQHLAGAAGPAAAPVAVRDWFATASAVIDELHMVELAALSRAGGAALAAIERQQRRLWIDTGILLSAWSLVAMALLVSLRRVIYVLRQLVVSTRRLLAQTGGVEPEVDLSHAKSLVEGWARVLDQAEQLQAQASIDALTGVFNRRGIVAAFEREHSRAQRHGRPLSLLILDLDHFKRVNDSHGHGAGDRVLRETCQRIDATLRRDDTFGRWGGEEFLVIAPESDEVAACALAEKLRAAMASRPFDGVGAVTISIGVAQWQANESLDELCARADRALYAAKTSGRNRCVRYSQADLPPAAPPPGPGLRLVGR